ncbi:retinol dehydrogenase 11-like [Belonocnema kinseyi]|uniref:retinol dehydrogenase 11-like n=1 Tax=Belonocnema kinseyi TaxID=2817044 RepID=UPI00143D66BF|nr:retinol dehydrogenase 11-like [Belonocnema kinseyi]
MVTYFYYIFILPLILKIWNVLTLGKFNSSKRLDGQVAIVTGATGGIGYFTALDLAKRGAKVIIACRNLIKANEVKDQIVKLSGNENVVVKHLDLSSLKSVRNFAKEINASENRLDILLNNAGAGEQSNQKSEDGLELTLQVNVYGPFLLTNLLIDLLKKSAPSRIIHVSSILHRIGRLDFNNMNCEKGSSQIILYCHSKLYLTIASNEMARRLEGTGVTSNSLHPGLVRTEITRHTFFPLRHVTNIILKLFFKNAEEGAQTSIYLAVSDDVTKISGKYFSDCEEATAAGITHDPEIGKKFWEKCCTIVGLKPEERLI